MLYLEFGDWEDCIGYNLFISRSFCLLGVVYKFFAPLFVIHTVQLIVWQNELIKCHWSGKIHVLYICNELMLWLLGRECSMLLVYKISFLASLNS